MKTFKIIPSLLFLLATIVVPCASAQTAAPGAAGAVPGPLGLTPEQQRQAQDVIAQMQTDLFPLVAGLRLKLMELQGLTSSKADPAAVEAKRKETIDLQSEIQRRSLEARQAIRNFLTGEQKVLFDRMGLGYGWGLGPCGLGLGRAWNRSTGRGRGYGRGGGWAAGQVWDPSSTAQTAQGAPATGTPLYGLGWGRGPCGMGLGRMGWWSSGSGRRPW